MSEVSQSSSFDVDEQAATEAQSAVLPRVRPVYQPIVDLFSGEVVAYEALARGPRGSALETPQALFAYAREHAIEEALDIRCRAAAMQRALQHRLPASIPLFVNAEPRWLAAAWPPDLAPIAETAAARLQLVVEITERALVEDPAALFAEVHRLRSAGCGVALDDVGADPASLALMPFIDPDVIKLDLRLIQERTSLGIGAIINAVLAQAERSGALILAEGIETEEHRRRAMAFGASLGQGWLLGRPARLPDKFVVPRSGPHAQRRFTRAPDEPAGTPFEVVRDHASLRTTAKELLLPLSHHLEIHALRTSVKPVLLAAFEDAVHFTPATARRYSDLADRCSFVGALGVGMDLEPAPGIRGAQIADDDPLRGEWVVTVVGPHFTGALIAKDLADTGKDEARRFTAAITHDPDLVLRAARSMFGRITRRRSRLPAQREYQSD